MKGISLGLVLLVLGLLILAWASKYAPDIMSWLVRG